MEGRLGYRLDLKKGVKMKKVVIGLVVLFLCGSVFGDEAEDSDVIGVINGWVVDRKGGVLTMTPVMTISETPGYDFTSAFHPQLDEQGRFASGC